jgi:hypothetical protein
MSIQNIIQKFIFFFSRKKACEKKSFFLKCLQMNEMKFLQKESTMRVSWELFMIFLWCERKSTFFLISVLILACWIYASFSRYFCKNIQTHVFVCTCAYCLLSHRHLYTEKISSLVLQWCREFLSSHSYMSLRKSLLHACVNCPWMCTYKNDMKNACCMSLTYMMLINFCSFQLF